MFRHFLFLLNTNKTSGKDLLVKIEQTTINTAVVVPSVQLQKQKPAPPPWLWGSYKNLTRLMTDIVDGREPQPSCFPNGLEDFMESSVTCTEKLHGSNLAMWVQYLPKLGSNRSDSNNWSVLLLQGRTSPLWKKEGFILDDDKKTGKLSSSSSLIKQDVDDSVNQKIRDELQNDLKKLQSLSGRYGLAGSLGKLPLAMKDFTVRFANLINVDQVEVFGEAFRASKVVEKSSSIKYIVTAEKPSWHPFGYKIPTTTTATDDHDQAQMKLTLLNSNTYKLFSEAVDATIVPTLPQTHDEMVDFLTSPHLKNNKNIPGAVFPPPAFCLNKPLIDCIETTAPLLLRTDMNAHYFEGVFIVHEKEEGLGSKFKTGTHEEQSKVPTLEKLRLVVSNDENKKLEENTKSGNDEKQLDGETDDKNKKQPTTAVVIPKRTAPLSDFEKRIVKVHGLIEEIFKTKIKQPNNSSSSSEAPVVKMVQGTDPTVVIEKKRLENLMIKDVQKAADRELSKTSSFEHIPRDRRQSIINELVPLVMEEVVKTYTDDDKKLPYSETSLKKCCGKVVQKLVFGAPYSS